MLTEVVDVEPGVEDVVCRLHSASSQIHHDLYAGSTYAFPGGVVLGGDVALRRAWSLDLRIILHSLPEWEKIHPWNQQ